MGKNERFAIGAAMFLAALVLVHTFIAALVPLVLLAGAVSALIGFISTIVGLSESSREGTYLGLALMVFTVLCCGLLMSSLAWIIPSTLVVLVCLYVSFMNDD